MKQYSKQADQNLYPFSLPDLPYDSNALNSYISSETLEYHHKKHHQTYIINLNNLIANNHELKTFSLEEIIHFAAKHGLDAIFNNAAQVWNHSFYWHCMKPNGGGRASEALYEKICSSFGDFETFITQFHQEGISQFGSGWVWLVAEKGDLKIVKTTNAQVPITKMQFPILTCDVWEHAYYIDYRNKRSDYLSIFLQHLINWDFAEMNFLNSQK